VVLAGTPQFLARNARGVCDLEPLVNAEKGSRTMKFQGMSVCSPPLSQSEMGIECRSSWSRIFLRGQKPSVRKHYGEDWEQMFHGDLTNA
jgi:hypothetical protein